MIRRSRASRARFSPVRLAAAVEACEPRRLLSVVAPAYAAQIGLTGIVSTQTSFEDNFDGTTLDKTKWQVRDGYRWRAYKDAPVSTFSYTDASSAVVSGGELALVAHNDPVTGQLKGAYLQSGASFNDASVNSPVPAAKLTPGYSGNFQQAYGYWETRAKFSSLAGEWASFWVHSYGMVGIRDDATKINQPAVYGTEMDVVEHSQTRGGTASANAVSMLDHYNGYGAYAKAYGAYPDTTTLAPQKSAPSAYHVYGMLWTSTSVKFYVDGALTNTVTDPLAISKVPQMAMLSVEVGAPGSNEAGKGSTFFGSTPAGGYGSVATSQARATFDYVRVWSLASATTTPTPVPTPTPSPTSSTGTVRGTAFVDANGNGKRDAGEAARAGLQIVADYNGDGRYTAGEPTATTAADGTYAMTGVRVGNSTPILVAPTSGLTQTLPAMRTATVAGVYWVSLSAGQTVAGIDFGVKAAAATTPTPAPTPVPVPTPVPTPAPTPAPTTATITGMVYLDANGNGARDASEAGRAGVRVFADYDGDSALDGNEPVATTIANGTYALAGVRVGNSTPILVVPTAGQTQTYPAGRYWVTLKAGQTLAATDFGVKLTSTPTPAPTPTPTPTPVPTPTPGSTTGTVTGTAFLDANGNGKRDAGEAGRAGVRVFADYNGNSVYDIGEPVATASSSGAYSLAGVRAGTATTIFTVAASGVTRTAPTPGTGGVGKYVVTLKAGQTLTNLDFGVKVSTGTGVSSFALPAASVPTAASLPTTASVAGIVYLDANANGRRDAGEAVAAGIQIVADYNGDGLATAGEPIATTAADGTYTMTGVRIGKSTPIHVVPASSLTQISPAMRSATSVGSYWVVLAAGQTQASIDFAVKVATSSPPTSPPTTTLSFAPILAAASTKLAAYDAATADKTLYPSDTGTGTAWVSGPASGWTSGFYPGALWLAYGSTGDAAMLARAKAWTSGLAGQASVTTTHDVGFQIFTSYGNAYRLTGDPAYKAVLLKAAYSLSSRFDPKTGVIRSWGNGPGNEQVVIDNMMNLELIEWAAKNGGTSAIAGWSLAQIAVSHADKTLATHLRGDGSTFHVVEYDPTTGAALDPTKYAGYKQSYSDASTWSRGQAWAIYGFTMMYRETGLTRYRDAAKRAADYFIAHLPADGVPPADFAYGTAGVPFSTAVKDSTAGAVAASALVEFSGLAATTVDHDRYFAAAQSMLKTLTSSAYLSLDNAFASLLKHGSGNAFAPTDRGYVFGDYYLMQAMQRYQAAIAK